MMSIGRLFGRKKSRQYPIRRDACGKTARQRCFEKFEENAPLKEIARQVGVKSETVATYHRQWQRNANLEGRLAFLKRLLRRDAPDRERTIGLLAANMGIPKEDMEAIIQQPHGLRRILTGKYYFPRDTKADHRGHVALELAIWLVKYLEKHGGNLEDVKYAFERWIGENQRNREKEDRKTEGENKNTAIIRQLLEVSGAQERQERVQLNQLTPKERETVLREGLKARARRLEMTYWQKVAGLVADGLTIEQARERIYQDLLVAGDVAGAEAMRRYQDTIHPRQQPTPPLPSVTPEPLSTP